MTTNPSMFPEFPDPAWSRENRPLGITAEDIRDLKTLPRADNSAYLAAVREFRERYEQAERDMGAPVEIAELVFRRK